jgi:hypothetical protein
MNIKTNKMNTLNEDQTHELARMFMNNFLHLEPLSLDIFLLDYDELLTEDQKSIGYFILGLFDKF